jgi:hypothetical protein
MDWKFVARVERSAPGTSATALKSDPRVTLALHPGYGSDGYATAAGKTRGLTTYSFSTLSAVSTSVSTTS